MTNSKKMNTNVSTGSISPNSPKINSKRYFNFSGRKAGKRGADNFSGNNNSPGSSPVNNNNSSPVSNNSSPINSTTTNNNSSTNNNNSPVNSVNSSPVNSTNTSPVISNNATPVSNNNGVVKNLNLVNANHQRSGRSTPFHSGKIRTRYSNNNANNGNSGRSSCSPPCAKKITWNSPQKHQETPRRDSPTSIFYAGAKFSETPSAACLPKPPVHWTGPFVTCRGEELACQMTNHLKMILNVHA